MPTSNRVFKGAEFDIDKLPGQIQRSPTLDLFRELVALIPKNKGKLVELDTVPQGNSLISRLASFGEYGEDLNGDPEQKYEVFQQKQAGSNNRYIWIRPKGEE